MEMEYGGKAEAEYGRKEGKQSTGKKRGSRVREKKGEAVYGGKKWK